MLFSLYWEGVIQRKTVSKSVKISTLDHLNLSKHLLESPDME